MTKPREFWIVRNSYGYLETPFPTPPNAEDKREWIHVIEKAAYDEVKNEWFRCAEIEKNMRVELIRKLKIAVEAIKTVLDSGFLYEGNENYLDEALAKINATAVHAVAQESDETKALAEAASCCINDHDLLCEDCNGNLAKLEKALFNFIEKQVTQTGVKK